MATAPSSEGLAGLGFAEFLAWVRNETRRWEPWFAGQPAAVWAVPLGDGPTATVRDLLFHVYVVDLRYAQRLSGLTVSTFEQEAVADPMGLFPLAHRGQDLLAGFIDRAGPGDWTRVLTFQTRSAGEITASARKVVAHTLTHHLRHLAQVATALRQHGFPSGWGHDLLLSDTLA